MIREVFGLSSWQLLVKGAAMTLLLSIAGVVVGTVLGIFGGIIRTYPSRVCYALRPLVWLWVEVFRRTPLMILMLLSYFGLAHTGFVVPPLLVGLLAVCVYSVAYMTENIRSGIEAIPKSQWDAGLSLGMNSWHLLVCVIMPQALRISIPPSIGFMQSLVKDTSVATIIGLVELTHVSQLLRYRFPAAGFTIFGTVLLLYFIICYPLSWFGDHAERKVRRA